MINDREELFVLACKKKNGSSKHSHSHSHSLNERRWNFSSHLFLAMISIIICCFNEK